MTVRKPTLWVLPLVAIAALVAAGCDHKHTTPIGDIVNNPRHFDGQTVEIVGHVDRVHDLATGIIDVGAYQVDDGTGRIWVLTRAGAPDRGREVWVKGRVDAAGRFGGEALGAVIEEHERKTR